MFTGIVEELGRVREISRKAGVTLLGISAKEALIDSKVGDNCNETPILHGR